MLVYADDTEKPVSDLDTWLAESVSTRVQRSIRLVINADGTLCRLHIRRDHWSGVGRLGDVVEKALLCLREIPHVDVVHAKYTREGRVKLLPDGSSEQDLLDVGGACQKVADKHHHLAQNPYPLLQKLHHSRVRPVTVWCWNVWQVLLNINNALRIQLSNKQTIQKLHENNLCCW